MKKDEVGFHQLAGLGVHHQHAGMVTAGRQLWDFLTNWKLGRAEEMSS